MTKHVLMKEQKICETSFFVEDVDASTRSIYRDISCAACLRKALGASEARTRALRDLLAKAEASS